MGKHSIPRGEKSSYGKSNGSPRHNPNHEGVHRLEDKLAGSDLPARDVNIKEEKK